MDIRVELRDVDGVQEEFEKDLDAFMEAHGFKWNGDGYHYEKRLRDISYKGEEGGQKFRLR